MVITFYAGDQTRMGNNLLWSRHIVWIFLIPVLFIIAFQVNYAIDKKRFSILIISIALMFGIYGLWDSVVSPNLKYGGRAAGGMNPIEYGAICASLAIVAFLTGIYHWRDNRKIASLFFFTTLLTSSATLLTLSRGAWVAMLVAVLFLFFLNVKQWQSKYRYGIGIFIVMVIALVSQTSVVEERIDEAKSNLTHYLASESPDDAERSTSIGARFEMWRASWNMFLENPVLGVGVGSYENNAKKLSEQGKVNRIAAEFYHPHNQYVSALATRGFVGLALLCTLLGSVFYFYWMVYRNAASSFVRMLAVSGLSITLIYITAGIFDVPVEGKPTLVFYVLLNALFIALIIRTVPAMVLKRVDAVG